MKTSTPTSNNASDATLRHKAVFETAIDGILTIDERGIVESMNPAAAKLFGFEEAEVIGNNVSMLMPSPYHEEHDGYLNRYVSTNKPHIIGIGREVQGKKKDGTVFPIRLAVGEMFLNDKRVFTGIIHDLTDVKTAERKILALNEVLEAQNEELEKKVGERTEKLAMVVNQLLQTNRKLEKEVGERKEAEEALIKSEAELKELLEREKELNELKSRFVSMASHEFRTPLSTILSSIELVEAYRKEEQWTKRSKHIERIKTTVNHLTTILNDFLSLSRLEEGYVQPRPETFVLKHFCDEILDEFREQLREGQTILHEDGTGMKEINADKSFLRHILLNLLSNASKYSGKGKCIRCGSQMTDTSLRICMQDEGIGIPKEDQKHLFTRFFRAHNVENIKGTGLGLHIVRKYVELLDGHISIDSEEGRGTTFQVDIPLKKNTEETG